MRAPRTLKKLTFEQYQYIPQAFRAQRMIDLKPLPMRQNIYKAKVCIACGIVLGTTCWVVLFLLSQVMGTAASYIAAPLGLVALTFLVCALLYL